MPNREGQQRLSHPLDLACHSCQTALLLSEHSAIFAYTVVTNLQGASVQVEDLSGLLRYLRGLALPCEPPVGVGSFLLLYASEREVVVWYSPAREQHHEGEVTIPYHRLAAAWEALVAGQTLDEFALDTLGEGPAGGRWLLALLAQVPGVRVQAQPLALAWFSDVPAESPAAPAKSGGSRRGRRRTTAPAKARTAGARARSGTC